MTMWGLHSVFKVKNRINFEHQSFCHFFLYVVLTPIATATIPIINMNSGHGLAVADPPFMPMSGICVTFDPGAGVGVTV